VTLNTIGILKQHLFQLTHSHYCSTNLNFHSIWYCTT